MIRHGVVRYGIAAAAALLLAACSGQQVQLEIKARMEGQPAAGATVTVDGKEFGVTDGTGVLAKPITRNAGAEVEVLVSKELSGHHIKPWKTTFLIKLGKDGKVVERYAFEADLPVTRYFTVAVNEGGTATAGTAEAALSLVRVRAGRVPVSGLSQGVFRDLVRLERRRGDSCSRPAALRTVEIHRWRSNLHIVEPQGCLPQPNSPWGCWNYSIQLWLHARC